MTVISSLPLATPEEPYESDHLGPALVMPVLSRREVEVLICWLRTDSKQEAADELHVSVSTVSTHISRIRAKYAGVGRPAGSKTSLFVRAIQDGHIALGGW